MKANIHPSYGPVTIQCACGNVIETQSTLQGMIHVEICSACHPFFTGKEKLVDTAGRIDRLKKKFGDKVALGSLKKKKEARPPKAKSASVETSKPAKSLEGTNTQKEEKTT